MALEVVWGLSMRYRVTVVSLALLVASTLVAGAVWAEDKSSTASINGDWIGGWNPSEADWKVWFGDGRFRAQNGDGSQAYEGAARLRPATEPAELDWVIEKCDCNNEGRTTLSIYRWKDDRLEFDTPAPGKPRSTAFPTEKGSLLVLRRKP